ncbi:MAG: recombinase family protein [Mycobacteriales bacterium]
MLRARVEEGWWIGPSPYGYRRQRHRAIDTTGKPGWRHRLIVDARRAATVVTIFTWCAHERLGTHAITTRLATAHDPHPRPRDLVTGRPRRWTSAKVRAILDQPAYLGYTVRGRTRHREPLHPNKWIWSHQPSHPALIDPTLFWTAYDRLHPTPENDTGARGTAEPTNDPQDPNVSEPGQRPAA